jgi:hypothetical protein
MLFPTLQNLCLGCCTVAARLISFGGFEARLRPTEVEFLDGSIAPDKILAKVVVVWKPVPWVPLVPLLEP